MSKINLETFKKLLNVKKGGAEFFRFLIKSMFWIFVIGAMFYGLIWTPNQKLNIEIAKSNIEVAKVQRSCDMTAKTQLAAALDKAKKEEKEVSVKEQEAFYLGVYNNCVFLEGMDFLTIKPIDSKVDTQAVETK